MQILLRRALIKICIHLQVFEESLSIEIGDIDGNLKFSHCKWDLQLIWNDKI